MKNKPKLTIDILKKEAAIFSKKQSKEKLFELYGVTDGKAVGTYIEHKFRAHLLTQYSFAPGNSANGIDFPDIGVDIKVLASNSHNLPVHLNLHGKRFSGLATACLYLFTKKPMTENRSQPC